MTRTKTLVAVGAVLVGLLGISAFAARGKGDPAERMERFIAWRVDDALDDINANDAQRKQVNEMKDRLIQDAKPLIEGHRKSKEDLLAQWNSATPDATKVHGIVDARVDAFRAFAHKLADSALELHRILTPEQRKDISEEVGKRHHRRW
jgi:periplasmic protein CpxP/Spy